MNVNPKKIIIMIIIVIILMLIIFFIKNKIDKKDDESYNQPEKSNIVENNVSEIESKKVTQDTMFYTVESCINKYYGYLSENKSNDDEAIGIDNEFSKDDIEANKNMRIKEILGIFRKRFIEKNDINENNIEKFIKESDNGVEFSAEKMNVIQKDNISLYAVYGKVNDLKNGDTVDEQYFIVELDESINTFSIELLKNVNKIDEIELKIEDTEIEENDYNQFDYTRLNDEEISKKYFDIYKEAMILEPEKAYNYLDKEYREKRFGNAENYIKYIENNSEELSGIIFKQYLVNEHDDYSEYVCKDQYQNLYIFNVTAVKEFTTKLDTYTIATNKFLDTYNDSKNEEKVNMNINKWFLMLNNRDYNSAYNVLDETFRNENFGNEENFEKYMKEMYPLHYKVTLKNFSEQSDVYTQDIIFSDITGEDELENENTIIMQLKDNTDFVMSFSVRRH